MSERKDLLKILIISSVTYGSGVLGIDMYEAFRDAGYKVDFLTKDITDGHPEFLNVLSEHDYSKHSFYQRWLHIDKHIHPNRNGVGSKEDYCFFYLKEEVPPVPKWKVLKKINKHYDFVIVVFWQELLSYATIRAIDRKLGGVPWFFFNVDFSTMTGGCHSPKHCLAWQRECGCCPAWDSNNPEDFTHHNIIYRQHAIRKLDITVCVNSFMRDTFFSKSTLFRDARFLSCPVMINENQFYPRDKTAVRHKLGLPDKRKVLFFGSQSLTSEYKGMKYLMRSLDILYNSMSPEERLDVLIVSAGRDSEAISSSIKFDYRNFGYVSLSALSELFAAADVFACPSVFDPGPMMVNQSVSCGTPVVAFAQGVMLDLNKNGNCGYTAKMRDVQDFSNGLREILSLPDEEYSHLRQECRRTAVMMVSRNAIVRNIINGFKKKV